MTRLFGIVKFISSEKATEFCEIFTLLMSYIVTVKSKVKILQNFVAFSEYMNLIMTSVRLWSLGLETFSEYLMITKVATIWFSVWDWGRQHCSQLDFPQCKLTHCNFAKLPRALQWGNQMVTAFFFVKYFFAFWAA